MLFGIREPSAIQPTRADAMLSGITASHGYTSLINARLMCDTKLTFGGAQFVNKDGYSGDYCDINVYA
jgi:hypothetical protein